MLGVPVAPRGPAALPTMADREVMSHLFAATTDDNEKVSDGAVKAISKAAAKSKEPALRDMAQWLADRLDNAESPTVKIKTLRIVTLMCKTPKAALFTQVARELTGGAVESATTFTCPTDPLHGDKPAEFVRANAKKCLEVLGGGGEKPASKSGVSEGVPPGAGGGMRSRLEQKAAQVATTAKAKAEAAAVAAVRKPLRGQRSQCACRALRIPL